jgi:hypothetical protein
LETADAFVFSDGTGVNERGCGNDKRDEGKGEPGEWAMKRRAAAVRLATGTERAERSRKTTAVGVGTRGRERKRMERQGKKAKKTNKRSKRVNEGV